MGREKVGIGTYTVADEELSAGSTLGGPKLCMVLKSTSAIGQIFSVDWGQNAFGALTVHHWDVESGLRLAPQPGTTILHHRRRGALPGASGRELSAPHLRQP